MTIWRTKRSEKASKREAGNTVLIPHPHPVLLSIYYNFNRERVLFGKQRAVRHHAVNYSGFPKQRRVFFFSFSTRGDKLKSNT